MFFYFYVLFLTIGLLIFLALYILAPQIRALLTGIIQAAAIPHFLRLLLILTGTAGAAAGIGFIRNSCNEHTTYHCVTMPSDLSSWLIDLEHAALGSILAMSSVVGVVAYSALIFHVMVFRDHLALEAKREGSLAARTKGVDA